jgi:hypothetical protein
MGDMFNQAFTDSHKKKDVKEGQEGQKRQEGQERREGQEPEDRRL